MKRTLYVCRPLLNAAVLRFTSARLAARWREFRAAGASWDHEGYQPHVTITYHPPVKLLGATEPFHGVLRFGPERFAAVDEDANKAHPETRLEPPPRRILFARKAS